MGPSGMNPWLRHRAQPGGQPEPGAHARPTNSADLLREIDEIAASCWEAWTPEKSAAEEFRAKLAAYILSYYRRRAPG